MACSGGGGVSGGGVGDTLTFFSVQVCFFWFELFRSALFLSNRNRRGSPLFCCFVYTISPVSQGNMIDAIMNRFFVMFHSNLQLYAAKSVHVHGVVFPARFSPAVSATPLNILDMTCFLLASL